MHGASTLVAVIGGGPAGALAAERLARAGPPVIVFDEKLAWEKPCGGGVTPKALLRYPFLAEASTAHNWIDECELISPGGRRVIFPLRQKISIFSRLALNGMLLHRARAAGAEIVQDRVISIEGAPGAWRLHTRSGNQLAANFVILAAGARSGLRARFARPFAAEETMVTAGYYIPGSSRRMQVCFVKGLEGYIWTFPRCDHYSAGIVGKALQAGRTTADLRLMLHEFLNRAGLQYRGTQFFSHIIPAPSAKTLKGAAFCGDGWAMVGDAAGLVDPITGEGIYYALRSAELLSQAMTAGRREAYRTLLSQDLLPELTTAVHYVDRFYRGTFLGQPILERMVQFAAESRRFRDIVSDLFAGAQGYVSLRGRCYRQLLPVLWEAVIS